VVINAFLDSAEDDGVWRHAFIHAEFGLDEMAGRALFEAFLVRSPADPEKPDYHLLAADVEMALMALHGAYCRAGQPFARLDLTIAAPDGRYRFEFGQQPSDRLAGRRDADADAYLLRRYAALIAAAS
jgi:hypothetical protein